MEPESDDEENETIQNKDTLYPCIFRPQVMPKTIVPKSLKLLPASPQPRFVHQKSSKNDLIIREHITRLGQVTFLKCLPDYNKTEPESEICDNNVKICTRLTGLVWLPRLPLLSAAT